MARILLVEDNEPNRDLLSRRLARRAYDVITAEDGAQGLARAEREAPDLILMDLNLPVLDGWEATRRLKASPSTRHIPVIALTAFAREGEEQRALEAGCDEFELKPVDLPRLIRKIEVLLPDRHSP